MTHRKPQQQNHQRAGFALTELLIVVAVLIVLMGIALLSVTAIRKNLRQKELDSKAEILYVAAQNRMAELRAAGYDGLYQYRADAGNGVKKVGLTPRDVAPDTDLSDDSLCYVESALKTGDAGEMLSNAADAVLPESAVDLELWNNQWHIEYDPDSGSVYGVFYSETDAIPTDMQALDLLRVKGNRLSGGAVVGYYGGDVAQTDSADALYPGITIVNAEKLIATFYCSNPTEDALTFTIRLSDGQNEYTRTVPSDRLEQVNSRTFRYTWVLDSLTSDSARFYAQTEGKLRCGADLNIRLTVSSENAHIDDAATDRTTNSLFAYREGTAAGTALIGYGRHLQNLDQASHVSDAIHTAVQISDISFRDDAGNDQDWYSYYGDDFKPIENDNLSRYTGRYELGDTRLDTAIYALHISRSSAAASAASAANAANVSAASSAASAASFAAESFAGLFRTFSGTLEHITLTATKIDGGTAVGALVGQADGDLKIRNCSAYLSRKQGDLDGIDPVKSADLVQPWLTGDTVGGLVGRTLAGTTVTIESSFAATALRGSAYAGGLVGYAAGAITANTIYSDCYLAGNTTGGIIGGSAETAQITLSEFYTAGYQTAAAVAAGVAAAPASMKNGYSACDFTTSSGIKLYSTAISGKAENIFYLSGQNGISGSERLDYTDLSKNGAAKLGAAFTPYSGGASYPYNLLNQGLETYSYPRLAALEHYGDWQAEFESGALVYYEVYADGSCGFQGANVSTLVSGKIAAGDGYALAYQAEQKPDVNEEIAVVYGEGYGTLRQKTFRAGATIAASSGESRYYLVPLPRDVVNPEYSDTSAATPFYQKIIVNDVTYYYNPYFAKTVVANVSGDNAPGAPDVVYLRTARQLYYLSRYYAKYADETAKRPFEQELDIDYTSYDWSYANRSEAVTTQAPIDSAYGFLANYNGGYHTVTGISIASSSAAIGLFGTIERRGTVRNLFLTGRVGTEQIMARNADGGSAVSGSRYSAQVGALAGVNSGTIQNCAVSGYTMHYYGYRSNVVMVGGMVGCNYGTIRGSSADAADLSLANTNATAYAGGFAGQNSGTILNSYALGSITVLDARNSTVWIAGFAADNGSGMIRRCYAATALTASGTAESYGFAHTGGAAVECWYLDGGTYSYAGKLYAYNTSSNEFAKKGLAAGTAITGAELQRLRMREFGTAAASYAHEQTGTQTDSYLYPTAVQSGGRYVHFGNWPMQQDIGTLGVFYWEYEHGGSNSGYHFSYVGTNQGDEISSDKTDLLHGKSLCEEHDDGGVITAYGYGYFYKADEDAPKLTSDDSNFGEVHTQAGEALHAQMPDYRFIAYQTGEGSTRLHTSAHTRNSTWTLYYGAAANPTAVYTYSVCPFFADALSLDSIQLAGQQRKTLDSVKPGDANNEYQIRSVAQLQNINWNSAMQTAAHSITSTTYQDTAQVRTWVESYRGGYYQNSDVLTRNCYPYLLSGAPGDIPAAAEELRWEQSHDLDSYGENGSADFTPIGSLYDKDNAGSTANPYVAFFAYSYDGQAYAIKNLSIHSTNQCVALFGITAGAQLRNIVMYSERNNEIVNLPNGIDWYNLGGLVGFAGSRKSSVSAQTNSVFTNCTVSGYQIIDRRGKGTTDGGNNHAPGWGGGNVGGLVGMTNMDITNCTSVNDIIIDVGYNNQYMNLRVGGIAGVCRATINSCYAGGSIESRVSSSALWDGGNQYCLNIWAGGIAGGIVVRNAGDMASLLGYVDRSLVVANCYSYVQMPAAPKTTGRTYNHVRASMSIASNGEMMAWFDTNPVPARTTRIYNCYALKDAVTGTSDYQNYASYSSFNGTNLNNIDSSSSRQVLVYNDSTMYLSYEEMADAQAMKARLNRGATSVQVDYSGSWYPWTPMLSGAFDSVTVEENGARIDGKYSFPGNDSTLKGRNYPFLTVLKQTDVFGRAVNVHYGTWSKFGLYWERTNASFDLFANRSEDAETGGTLPLLALKLRVYGSAGGTLTADDITICDDEGQPIAAGEVPLKVHSVSGYQTDTTGGYYTVTFTGLRKGMAYVYASLGGKQAETMITVTGEMTLVADMMSLTIAPGQSMKLGLRLYTAGEDGSQKALALDETMLEALQWTVEANPYLGDVDPVISYPERMELDETKTMLLLPVMGNVVSESESVGGQLQIVCTYQYGDAQDEKLTAECKISTTTLPVDVVALSNGATVSGARILYSGEVRTQDPAAAGATMQTPGLYLTQSYLTAMALDNVTYAQIRVLIDGTEYLLDENGDAYTTAGEDGKTHVTLGAGWAEMQGMLFCELTGTTEQARDVTLRVAICRAGETIATLETTIAGTGEIENPDETGDKQEPDGGDETPGEDGGENGQTPGETDSAGGENNNQTDAATGNPGGAAQPEQPNPEETGGEEEPDSQAD